MTDNLGILDIFITLIGLNFYLNRGTVIIGQLWYMKN